MKQDYIPFSDAPVYCVITNGTPYTCMMGDGYTEGWQYTIDNDNNQRTNYPNLLIDKFWVLMTLE